jgi:hypothetical protein
MSAALRTKAVVAAFYLQQAYRLEQLASSRHPTNMPEARLIVRLAREQLGYSDRTSAIDIISPLVRGYRKWKRDKDKP